MKKRVLITGGAGFIAHHTIKHILEKTDWEIVSLDRLDYSGNLNRISDMMKDISEKDKKDWENFISSDEHLPNKDYKKSIQKMPFHYF